MAANPYTFAQLKADLRLNLFPTGEADNLVGPHNQMFVEAMVDIQRADKCLQINNVEVIAQCDTLFQAGHTIIDKPSGRCKKLYVIDKINQTTGLEDASQPLDWSSDIIYRQCRYEDLKRFISNAIAGSATLNGFLQWFTAAFGLNTLLPFVPFPQFWFSKWAYPPPSDAGLGQAPPLPLGYHYAQQSTDAPGQRSQFGMWAVKGGQIFIAPWIQSTETIVLEWDGIKSSWQDTDLVHSGPTFKLAVENYVRWQHEAKYGRDSKLLADASQAYAGTISQLIYDCRQSNLIRDENDPQNMVARGSGFDQVTYSNTPQSATANCPTGQNGTPVTVTIPAGQVVSTLSVQDANNKAQSLALQQAGAQLLCTANPAGTGGGGTGSTPTYQNNPQTYTAHCISGQGAVQTATVTISAGQYQSTVSQADADAQALTAATSQATAQLQCVYLNAKQTATGACPNNASVTTTQTIQAGQYQSSVSQAAADAAALQAAQNLVAIWVSQNCGGGGGGNAPLVYNTAQTATVTFQCKINVNPGNPGSPVYIYEPITVTVTVAANIVAAATQAFANQQALQQAQQQAYQQAILECASQGGTQNP